MRQSTLTFSVLLFMFIVFITVRGQLPAYLALFKSKKVSSNTSGSGSSSAGGGSFGGGGSTGSWGDAASGSGDTLSSSGDTTDVFSTAAETI